MDEPTSIQALSALAHPIRLRTVRLLLEAGPGGLPAGEIAGTLDVPRSTLSAHLRQLERAGLLAARRVHQQIFYAADVEGSRALVRFLVHDCGLALAQVHDAPSAPVDGRDTSARDPSPTPATVSLLAPQRRRIRSRKQETPMSRQPFNVLFLCSANSARSILAECLLNRLGAGRFKAHSAGSHPAGQINPYALEVLERNNFVTGGLRSKSWNEFAGDDAPHMDFVFTVCDDAAGEACPVWPGQPITAHWGITDPAAAVGDEWQRRAAFTRAFAELKTRIDIFANLPLDGLDRVRISEQLDRIGDVDLAAPPATEGQA
jgi:arsenate reductase